MKSSNNVRIGSVLLALLVQISNGVQAAVLFNEVLANNATLQDVTGNTPDWVELYNTSTNDINLAGMSLTSDPLTPRRWVFPERAVIRANGYWVVFFDGDLPPSAWNTGFGLNTAGDAVYLYDPAVNAIDSVTFGLQVEDLSIGRFQVAGGAWSLMEPTQGSANKAAVLGSIWALRINEWMADATSGNDWFELFNPDANPVELSGVFLSNSLSKNPYKYRLPALSFIGGGARGYARFWADDTPEDGANHVNFKLSRSGDEIGLFPEVGLAIDTVTFAGQATGVSEGRLPDGSARMVPFVTSPSPGKSNYLPLPNVVINEALTHTDPPQEDAVELFNPSTVDADIGGWYLSDSLANLKKFRISPNTILARQGYQVFYEHQLTNSPTPFRFNSSEGDGVYLSVADAAGNLTGYRAEAQFGAAANGVSFGRYTNSAGAIRYVPLLSVTLGEANSGPRVGPVVINEIMYHPAPLPGATNDNLLDEYIELFNLTTNAVALYDPVEPTNTWRIGGGVDYPFPMGTRLPPGGYLLVVSFNPQLDATALIDFRRHYGLGTPTLILGPYSRKLGNGGDTVELEQPDSIQGQGHINQGRVPYVEVDRIEYSNLAPWPGTAGTGQTVQRRNAFEFGDDPANWFAGMPTPLHRNAGGRVDRDGDGMPDDWELAHALAPNDPSDATGDPDRDRTPNLPEFLAGTDPRDPNSALRLEAWPGTGPDLSLRFSAVPGQSYTVQYRDSLASGSWINLTSVGAVLAPQVVEVKDTQANLGSQRYYRIVTLSVSPP